LLRVRPTIIRSEADYERRPPIFESVQIRRGFWCRLPVERTEEIMARVVVEPRPARTAQDEAVVRNLERVAWLMDRALKIPGTKISVGLDALLGLLPIGGDVATGLVQVALVLVALRYYHVPKSVATRMMANVLLDVTVGSIPLVGDLFDAGFKANTRNMKLLEPYGHPPTIDIGHRELPADHPIAAASRGTPWRYILPIAAVLCTVLALVMIGFITVVRWLFGF
jgi:hypothetical protein